MKHLDQTELLEWRVNTAGLLGEIMKNNMGLGALSKPVQIFGLLLHEVGACAARINDPELNKLMARLAIYAETDPYSEYYSEEITNKLLSYKP